MNDHNAIHRSIDPALERLFMRNFDATFEPAPTVVEMKPDASDRVERKRPPADRGWRIDEVRPEWTKWVHASSNAQAIIAVEEVESEVDGQTGLEWHLSVSVIDRKGRAARAGRGVVAMACRDFDMNLAWEDNHVHGVARHFWMAVNPDRRGACACEVEEPVSVEPIAGAGDEGDEYVVRPVPK